MSDEHRQDTPATTKSQYPLPWTVESGLCVAPPDRPYHYLMDADGNTIPGTASQDDGHLELLTFIATAVNGRRAVAALMHEMQVRADNDMYLNQMFSRLVPADEWSAVLATLDDDNS